MFSKVTLLLVAALAHAAVPAALAGTCGKVLISQNFNEYGGGKKTYSKDMASDDFSGFSGMKSDARAQVGDGHLESEHPKGCYGTKNCGVQFDAEFSEVTEATVSYKVKFEAGYDWVKGGKLPGLCDKDCPSGCVSVPKKGGFSARIMWREGGMLESYSYYPEKKESCGETWDWGMGLKSGTWNTIKMHVKLNDVGQSNGEQTVELNGKRWYKSGLTWRNDDRGIARFTFRNFHGGSSGSWASGQDQSVYFDDIKVVAGNCAGKPISGGRKFIEEEDPVVPDDTPDDSPDGSDDSADEPSAGDDDEDYSEDGPADSGSDDDADGDAPAEDDGNGEDETPSDEAPSDDAASEEDYEADSGEEEDGGDGGDYSDYSNWGNGDYS